MRPDLLSLIPIVAYALLLVIAALVDFFQRRIPNWIVVALILLFAFCAWQGFTRTTWQSSLAAFAIALGGGGALYLLKWFGAGDAKLFAATALFAGLSNLLLLFTATTIAGGIYAMVVLLIRPKSVLRGMTAKGRAEAKGKLRGIPYGVAIAVGALITGSLTHFLEPRYHLQHIDLGSKLEANTQR